MSLRERLTNVDTAPKRVNLSESRIVASSNRSQLELRVRLHQELLDRVDLARLQKLTPELMRLELKMLIEQLIDEEQLALSEVERRNLVRDIQYEMLGFGPLEPCLPIRRSRTFWSTPIGRSMSSARQAGDDRCDLSTMTSI